MKEQDADQRGGVLHRFLSLFTEIEPREVFTVLLLTLNVFLLLTAYYFLKVVREPLILAGGGIEFGGKRLEIDGPEVKAYAAAGQALLMIGIVRAYGAMSKRFGRMQLSAALALFFGSNLVVFFILARLGVPLGIPFYLWVGCFSLTVIAQFWSFANDVYTPAQGKRLFAVVGVGSSMGAMFGAQIAKRIYVPFGPYNMMLAAAGVLMICLWITYVVHRWELTHQDGPVDKPDAPPGGSKGGFAMVLSDRYLLLIAALTLVLNQVNSTGEYILDRTLVESATRTLAPLAPRETPAPEAGVEAEAGTGTGAGTGIKAEAGAGEEDAFAPGALVYVVDLEASRILDGKVTAVKPDGDVDVEAGGQVVTVAPKKKAFPRTEKGKKDALGAVIGTFKGDYFYWVNTIGVVLQLFVVSRIFKYFGVRVALFILPCIALFGYSALAFAPILGIVRIAKISENSTDYSIQNTAKQALFLPVSREAKYNAKAAIDTFVVRAGDVLSAILVVVGQVLALATRSFAVVNLVLVIVWLLIVAGIAREHRKRTADEERPGQPEQPAAAT
jgi:AAA family ATP:ADP antiporter